MKSTTTLIIQNALLFLVFSGLSNVTISQVQQAPLQYTQAPAGHHAQATPEKQVFHTNHSEGHQCAFDHRHEQQLLADPVYQAEIAQRETMIRDIIQADFGGMRDAILTVPVVVHIIHKGEPVGSGTNISDEQIYSAINALNEDYRKMPGTNGDGAGVDTDIEFCLAVRDPDDNPTNGINRVDGRVVSLYEEQGITAGQGQGAVEMNVKNLSRWPNQQYYNIWIVSEIENNNGQSGIQGYAYFPTTSSVDGTVILYNAFGTVGNLKSYTNMNRTTTHELGHGLNLYHTFQGGNCNESNCSTQGDRVCDTPPTTSNSNCNSPACGGTQQVENYLDYTSQTCKDMFTAGQKNRMRAALMGARANLLNSQACTPVSNLDAGITAVAAPTGQLCSPQFTPTVTLTNYGSATLTSVTIQYSVNGTNLQTYSWSGSLATGTSQEVTLPAYTGPAGGGNFMATTIAPNGGSDQNASNDTSTSAYETISGNGITVTIVTDYYGTETSWKLFNNSNEVIASGGPYVNGAIGTNYVHNVCLEDGCYEFKIYDSYEDGFCCSFGAGSYTVQASDGSVLASGSQFAASEVTPFCVSSSGGAIPVSNFIAENTAICVGESIDFSDMSTDGPTQWEWTFDGGTPATSTAQNPANITFSIAGTYNVTLKAINEHGYDVEIKSNYISVTSETTWYTDNDGDGYGNPFSSVSDCDQPSGFVSNNGDCNDNNASVFDNCVDCAGAMWGSAYVDNCGNCVAGTTGLPPCTQDCNGVWGGTASTDNCGLCVGGNTGNTPCGQDCNGVWGGTATTDDCGNCVGGNTGETACVQDCNGVWGGTAYPDNCGTCVGGNTGATACVQDCNGQYGGNAFLDDCGNCVGGNTGESACAADCAGVAGGSAYLDNCNECVGGTTGETACVQDCNGVWGGTAYQDNCGTCVGGNTGATACVQDCNGQYGGNAFLDDCGNCVGGNTGETACTTDCAGVPGGSAYLDNCSECVGGTTGETDCIQDCNGVWGGTAYNDNCGDCVGGNTGETACITDCAGVPGGSAYLDNCNECVGGTTGETACVQDCNGDWGGTATIDNCGDCVGGNTGEAACATDCAGVPGGSAYLDNCNNCVGGTTGEVACVQDCNGVWGGTATIDNCGNCVGGNTGETACVQDCNGDWGGTATIDNCGDCVGGNTGETACATDCAGVPGGSAYLDNCNECVGGTTGEVACVQDCNGVWGGTATTDNCGNCVGGNTGETACIQDCNGDWGGTATIDNCGDCVGGNTGETACATDCAGVPGGSAYLDNCDNCVGGTTGEVACVQDCNGVWGGTAYTDDCDNCVGGNTGNVPCSNDCAGVPGGSAFIDNCNECVGGTTGETACTTDCAGVPGGSAFTDNCGECVGGDTGIAPCVQDCNGDWGGNATTDNCGNCVGGNTGETACTIDCAGVWGGSAYLDNCDDCVGGNTGNTACIQDCNGDWGGNATTDNCGNCVGGNTNITPCVEDCNGVWGGTAYTDGCGTCVGGNTGNEPCDDVNLCEDFELVLVSTSGPTCHDDNDGSITVAVQGGSENITYTWSNGQNGTTASLFNIGAGNYTVEATDNTLGCSDFLNITIEETPELVIESIEIVNPTCTGMNNGSLVVIASGGTGALMYNWNDPAGQSGQIATDLAAGQYAVSVMDQNGCVVTGSATLFEPDGLSVEITATNADCENNGSVSLDIDGGSGNYIINWSVSGYFNQQVINGLEPGDYMVWVTDELGCMDIISFTIGLDCPLGWGTDGMTAPPDTTWDDTGDITNDPLPIPLPTPSIANLTIYPNPNNGENINIALEKSMEVETLELEMMDLTGRRIFKRTVADLGDLSTYHGLIDFDTKLPFGIYLLHVRSGHEFIVHKIVVK